MEEMGTVRAGALRWYTLVVSDSQPEEHPVAFRAEAFVGAIGLCIRRPAEPHGRLLSQGPADDDLPELKPSRTGVLDKISRLFGRRPLDWAAELGCWHSSVADSSARAEQSLAAFDLSWLGGLGAGGGRFELAVVGLGQGGCSGAPRPRGCSAVIVGLGPNAGHEASSGRSESASAYALRALVGSPVTLAEEHTVVVDALGPLCCTSSLLPAAQSLQRTYRHYARSAKGSTLLVLRPLGLGSLAGAELKLRASGGSAGWQMTATAEEDSEKLSLPTDLAALAPGVPSGHGFWLEIHVQVLTPLNFTLSLQPDFADPESGHAKVEPASSTRLVPNVKVIGKFVEASGQAFHYDFHLASGKAGNRVLRFNQCYGRATATVSYLDASGQSVEAHSKGMDADVLPLPRGDAAPDDEKQGGSSRGTTVVEGPGSVFEIELATGAEEELISLPRSLVLVLSPRQASPADGLTFQFGAAELGTRAGAMFTDRSSEPGLHYALVAVNKSIPGLHANTTCGLQEAMERGAAIQGHSMKAVKTQLLGQLLQATLPWPGGRSNHSWGPNESFEVNLLVTLVTPSGRQVSARNYHAFTLSARSLDDDARNKQKFPGGVSPIYGIAVLVVGVSCFIAIKRRSEGGESTLSRDLAQVQMVEKEPTISYDVQDLEDTGRSRLLRSSYVPPTV
ncbi:unnamed protein product [Polarella glacialis]|uniref:Uncharacterized protein n=1 Tax=Polarella glacialis TaxID=89957 RepID=A0A813EKW5_POLGL|nr:unnamed protein product [Polarella glacialis]